MSDALAALPGARRSELEIDELRRSFLAMSTELGAGLSREIVDLAEAVTLVCLGDSRGLRDQFDQAVARVRLASESGSLLDALPGEPLPVSLQDRARSILHYTPQQLLAALGDGKPEQTTDSSGLIDAMREDARNLQTFTLGYLQLMMYLSGRVGQQLMTDSLTLADLDAFLAGRRFEKPSGSARQT